ncbi:MAG: hypothetical protein AABX96_05135 [Nanoarchaeota archaeon]
MMTNSYLVYTTETFDKEVLKLSKDEQERIDGLYKQLKKNPYVGDQLRYKHFREKRLREKRIYYLVYDHLHSVLLVTIGGKKDQQATIDHIIDYFDEYQIYLEKLIKNNN